MLFFVYIHIKHWHGAGPKTAMTHIAIQEALNGSPVTWMEKVTDEGVLGHSERCFDVDAATKD